MHSLSDVRAFAAEYLPIEHGLHPVRGVTLSFVDQVPGPQFVHEVCMDWLVYCPDGQIPQVEESPAARNIPGLQPHRLFAKIGAKIQCKPTLVVQIEVPQAHSLGLAALPSVLAHG
jgi:hypothetical protein